MLTVGERIHEWTIESVSNRVAYCRCSCGESKDVWISNLVSGKSKSCGHKRRVDKPIVGDTVGEWTVIKYLNDVTVYARCSCGVEKNVSVYSLGKDSKSCGHFLRSGPRARLLWMWKWMHSRCYNDADPMYRYYGGRGIYVVDEWHDPEEYIAWALEQGFKKSSGLQVDRVDNDGPYSPSNCRVTTRTINANNKSNNVVLEAFGESKTLGQWAADSRCAVAYPTLWARYRNGWDAEAAITNPPRHR